MSCRICLEEEGPFVSPCACKGSTAYIHEGCLNKWIDTSGATTCEICREDFTKEEVCAFEPRKYSMACFACQSNSNGVQMRIGMGIVGTTLIVFSSIEEEYYLFLSIIFNVSLLLLSAVYQIMVYRTDGLDVGIHNVLMTWKMCFSIPFACVVVVNYMILADACDTACMTLSRICDGRCPYYHRFMSGQNKLQHAMFIDVVNILIYICVRATVLCFTHMRRLKFSDRTAEEETLLDHSSDSFTNLSGTDSSSADSPTRSSSFDILAAATNDSIDRMI